ncbi:MAG: radical SAM protein, partial [Phycisphaerae bacterium]|nr:radical SAM protein [Phycisphaerae bacterium]
LSTADYPKLAELVSTLHEQFKDKYVGLSLPSLRVDKELQLVPELVTEVRKGGLTIAVEAASEKVREAINKPLKDSDLFAAVEAAYQAGWQRLKLYFMVGLPGETEDDIRQLVRLARDLGRMRKRVAGQSAQINAAVSWFVPKPHTPLSWVAQRPQEYFENAKQIILAEKRELRANIVTFKFHDIRRSVLESAIGRGDRRLSDIIELAWRKGARFDLWNECFDFEIWKEAFAEYNMDINIAAQREFGDDEILPWDHLGGPDKQYLLSHLREARVVLGVE